MNKEEHKKFAIDTFNKTWGFIDKQDRSLDEYLEMIHLAHTSRYHWGFAGNELNKARGEWQISRVYSLLGMGESSLKQAEVSLSII